MRSPSGSPSCWRVRSLSCAPAGAADRAAGRSSPSPRAGRETSGCLGWRSAGRLVVRPSPVGGSCSGMQHHRQSLSDADTDRGEPVAAAAAAQLVGELPRMRAPDAPSGCPIAIAPPFEVEDLGVELRPAPTQASDWAANASLSSTGSGRPSRCPPARARARPPRPGRCRRRRGSTACTPRPAMRASGSRPSLPPAASSPIHSAPAPSLSGEALPAVTVPSVARRRASACRAPPASCRGRSSRRARAPPGTGDDPVVVEAGVPGRRGGRWLRSANSSCCSRVMPWMPASFSVLSPSEIVHCAGIRGLTMRQPSVVECSVCIAGGKRLLGLEQDPRRA